ncbi:MAG: 3-hydroxyacyl-CoA dehydrogenase NAD-binding domain-containing protein [Tunicatimonas sp.]|uniref:3-hydroxyacyl-CoA dehydrogenase family protein n=1 Tax=Tunicatimonas sp. TaxID=1940096 RepID=UPI003C73FE6A
MNSVAVVGAGTMGNGIAHVFALHGFTTVVVDINPKQLEQAQRTVTKNLDRQLAKELISEEEKKAALKNLATSTSLSEGVSSADLVIEAATENLDIKKEIFQAIDQACKPETILATNTSSISITKLAAETKRPTQVIGMHFMNPVPVMKLVEIINGYATSPAVTSLIQQTAEQLQKIPLVVNDYPGFVSNRILMPMINEAIYTLYEGVAGVHEIDQIMQLGMAHPMGPLKLADFIGLDVCLSIMRVLHEGFGNPKYAPCPLLVNMVAAQNLGIKSKEGFYDYQEGPKSQKISSQFGGKG